MFKLVTKQLIKFVFVFFFFLLGFALSFHIMFQGSSFNKEGSNNSDAFSTPWSSLLRTLSMMVGDTIDFETLVNYLFVKLNCLLLFLIIKVKFVYVSYYYTVGQIFDGQRL